MCVCFSNSFTLDFLCHSNSSSSTEHGINIFSGKIVIGLKLNTHSRLVLSFLGAAPTISLFKASMTSLGIGSCLWIGLAVVWIARRAEVARKNHYHSDPRKVRWYCLCKHQRSHQLEYSQSECKRNVVVKSILFWILFWLGEWSFVGSQSPQWKIAIESQIVSKKYHIYETVFSHSCYFAFFTSTSPGQQDSLCHCSHGQNWLGLP